MNLSEAVATANVKVSRWRDIRTTEEALSLLNRALQEANRYCRSPGHEVRNPYNRVMPVRWGTVAISTEKGRSLVRANIRPDGRARVDGSNLTPGAALVEAVRKQAATEDAEQRARRAEAERRESLRKAREEEQRRAAELKAKQQAEQARARQAALKECGREPIMKGGPWRSWVSSAYKFAVQDLVKRLTSARDFRTAFLCVKSVEYLGDAPNPFGGNAARLKVIGADYRTYEMTARTADVPY
jgi:hypothetical protein